MCTRGRDETRRALPSFSTRQIEPVSATAKFAPVIPTSAVSNTSRRCARAKPVSSARSVETSRPASCEKSSATSSAVLSIAGAMMCCGCSPASWRIHSPRSVSTTSIPAPWSASLRPISSVAIDFDLATSFAPVVVQISTIFARAAAASAQRWTRPPRASSARWNVSRWVSSSATVRVRISRPCSRSAWTSSSAAQASSRCPERRAVEVSSAASMWSSASAVRAFWRKRPGG